MEEEERELNIEDKEATTVEEVEAMIRDTPITVTDERETVVRDTPGHQPDKPIQKEDMSIMSMQEMLKIIMEKMDRNHETLKQIMNDRKHMIEEMMNDRNPVSYTHLDVYKRQV